METRKKERREKKDKRLPDDGTLLAKLIRVFGAYGWTFELTDDGCYCYPPADVPLDRFVDVGYQEVLERILHHVLPEMTAAPLVTFNPAIVGKTDEPWPTPALNEAPSEEMLDKWLKAADEEEGAGDDKFSEIDF